MDPSRLYVPDPQKWVKFYKNVAEGKVKQFATNQVGAGSAGHSFITPIDKYLTHFEKSSSSNQPPVKLVSPTEQIVDQAKNELKREGEDLKSLSVAMKSHKRKRHTTKRIPKKRKRQASKKSRKYKHKPKTHIRRSKKTRQSRGKKIRKQTFSRRDIFEK